MNSPRSGRAVALGFIFAAIVQAFGWRLSAGQARPGTAAGTYTPEQAAAGKATYEEVCAGCHRSDFQGEQDAKPLAGGTFLNSWRGKTSDDLFNYISRAMPPGTPGMAGDDGNLTIVAYLLQANKVAAGSVALDYESAVPIPTPADRKQ